MTKVQLGFIPEPLNIPLDMILPSRKAPEGLLMSRKFKQIRSSIEAVGLIEPLSIGPADKKTGQHIFAGWQYSLNCLARFGIQRGIMPSRHG
jgi:hypothetical protein